MHPSNDKQACRKCGCTWNTPCYDHETGSCWWVQPDLCSACATEDEKQAAEIEMARLYAKPDKKKKNPGRPAKSKLNLLLGPPKKETLKKDLRNIGDSIESLSIFNKAFGNNFRQ